MTVSICVVARNEQTHLPNLLADIAAQTYPHEKTEIILVDSASTDNTKSIMEAFAADNTFFRVQVLDNPGILQAAGWNVAIRAARNDVIIRIDAHTEIPADFVEKNMVHQTAGEYITGGMRPCRTGNMSGWGKTLLQVENSLFGSSANKSRRSEKQQYVKSLFHGAYRREVFEKVGLFNEKLGRTEDNELHYRMRKAGYRFFYDPKIISYQYARGSLREMLRQKFMNGYWVGLTLGVCPGCLSLYHFVPFAFVAAMLGSTVLAVLGIGWCLAALAVCYGFVAVGMTVLSVKNEGMTPFCFLMPALFFLLHCVYGVGTVRGLAELPFRKKSLCKK